MYEFLTVATFIGGHFWSRTFGMGADGNRAGSFQVSLVYLDEEKKELAFCQSFLFRNALLTKYF